MVSDHKQPHQPCIKLFFFLLLNKNEFFFFTAFFQVFIHVFILISHFSLYKGLFTVRCLCPCVLCWVYCVQWSALVSCWQALGSSLWACCPSTPYHRSIDLLLRVPASASVPAFFMSVPVSLPPCLFPPSAPLSDPLPSFLHFYLFAAIISCVYLYHFELRCIYMQVALLFLV